jgi:hypothetical protein
MIKVPSLPGLARGGLAAESPLPDVTRRSGTSNKKERSYTLAASLSG